MRHLESSRRSPGQAYGGFAIPGRQAVEIGGQNDCL